VLLAVCKATGSEWGCIPRIASGLGGGMGSQGEVCGAVTGAVLGLGLVHGRDRADEQAAKQAVSAKAGHFVQRFAEVHGAVRCRDLLGLDVGSEEGLQAYRARNLQEARCAVVVGGAVGLVLELLDEWADGSSTPRSPSISGEQ
jgi:C_GCAxxG_C_C family probable redox protein